MREDEENCKIKFDEFLRLHYQGDDIIWKKGDEPPDYYLQLCGTTYAVEVTTLMEIINLGSRTSSHLGFRKAVLDFLKQIEKQALEEGILKGAYVVGYKPLNDFSKQKRGILKSIKAYILANQDTPSTPESTILDRGHLSWNIVKLHSEKNYLTGVPADAKWNHQAEDELTVLLNNVLDGKVQKLAAISYPKILLIADRYPWVERGDWNSCLPNLNQLSKFHTVFLVSHDRGNSVLHSSESKWLNRL